MVQFYLVLTIIHPNEAPMDKTSPSGPGVGNFYEAVLSPVSEVGGGANRK